MFRFIRIWLARCRLESAEAFINERRQSADFVERQVLPDLRRRLRDLELRDSYLRIRKGSSYQWGGRTNDRLPLDGRTKPVADSVFEQHQAEENQWRGAMDRRFTGRCESKAEVVL